jgi:hypothetical protein
MKRLKQWLRKRLQLRPQPIQDLPFTAEEFARLVYSRNPQHMKILARGLANPRIGRRPSKVPG